jgi:hypothetical protein
MDLGFRLVAGALHRSLAQCAVDRHLEQRNELAPDILDQIVGGAGLQRGDGDRRILRGGDEHHRRGVRDRHDPLQRFEAVEPWHELVERDNVDAALRQPRQPGFAARRMNDLEAGPRQAAVDQPGKTGVVVDIQQCRRRRFHMAAGGT